MANASETNSVRTTGRIKVCFSIESSLSVSTLLIRRMVVVDLVRMLLNLEEVTPNLVSRLNEFFRNQKLSLTLQITIYLAINVFQHRAPCTTTVHLALRAPLSMVNNNFNKTKHCWLLQRHLRSPTNSSVPHVILFEISQPTPNQVLLLRRWQPP